MSDPRSVVDWADAQRALRDRAAVPGFEPVLRPVGYRVIARSGPGAPAPPTGLVPRVALVGVALVATVVERSAILTSVTLVVGFLLIIRWFWHGADKGRRVAVSPADLPRGCVPAVVFTVGEDALVDDAPVGEASAFGDLMPGGVLGLVVGGTTVWPTSPPRAGTTSDVDRPG